MKFILLIKKLKDIKTLWGESLSDFHKKLFNVYDLKDINFHDESEWYRKNNIKNVNAKKKANDLHQCPSGSHNPQTN